jgi:hypothetical protein
MITSAPDEQRIEDVRTDDRTLTVRLVDGRMLSVPLDWHPRLLDASEEQRNDWRLIGGGVGVHWPQIDEDLSLDGMLRGVRSPAQRPGSSSVSSWARQQTQAREDPYLQQAQDFFARSMGRIKGRMQSDSAQLESFMQQLPEEYQAQIQEMTDSYALFGDSIDQATQDAGVQDVMEEEAQEARQAADEAMGQGQEPIQQATNQVQDAVVGTTEQVQDTVGGVTEGLPVVGDAVVGGEGGGPVEQVQDTFGPASSGTRW